MMPDPYAPHLRQADDFFAQGEIVKAGQIWQAILKQQPSHSQARKGLMVVKEHLLALREAEAIAAPAPEVPLPAVTQRVITGALDPDRLLTEGCTLYDLGQTEDALRKWEQVLLLNPAHALARSYANGARQELGMPPLQAPADLAPVPAEAPPADDDIDKLLREAVQLYDMGLVEEAITKWERILILEPQRQEIEEYLRQARTEVGLGVSALTAPIPDRVPAPGTQALALKLRQAEHLLTLQRHEEAAFTFQQALVLDPGNAHALQGLASCRKPSRLSSPKMDSQWASASDLTLDSQGRIAVAKDESPTAAEPQGVDPPAALLKPAPAPREGPSLPDRLRQAIEQVPWLKNRTVLAGVGGAVLALVVGFGIIHSYQRDKALKEEVHAARAAAVAPVARQIQAPDLAESPAAIRQEAETALGLDPLRAYLRAETFVSVNSGDSSGAQLLEKARSGLAGGVTGASLSEFQKHLQNGNLEAALRVMDGLLRAQPGDADLRARAGRLQLTLCFAHANQGKWDQAQEDLLRGRALFPGDKTWQTRLKLLEHVKAMPKAQQASWIPLLS